MRFTNVEPAFATLTPVAGGLAFRSTYDASMVAALKAKIPAGDRRWDNDGKRWLVDPTYAKVCVELAAAYLGVDIAVPKITAPQSTIKTIKVEYIGRCKDREDTGELSAFGWANGGWNIIIPEKALLDWFQAEPAMPNEAATLYAVLAVKQTATVDEIRSSYRRLVKQWHPDVCHESNAAEMFKAIDRAYKVLADALTRKKYDAGLAMIAATNQQKHIETPSYAFRYLSYNYDGQLQGYRAPLRCGYLLVECIEILGRVTVSKILAWEDIVRPDGKTMIVSWPMGAKMFEVEWN